ncbi:MAG: uridine kinase [candidate division WOR-3 bacterium]|jgi:uridine kinase
MRVKRLHPIRVAIDGIDNAGKTTLAAELGKELDKQDRSIIHASIDGFHRPRNERYKRGALSPDGYFYDSFDLDALQKNLLEPLGPSGDLQYTKAVFDFRTDQRVSMVLQQAPSDAILLFDGVFLLRPELNARWDFRIYVYISFETSMQRALLRDAELFGSIDETRKRYVERYIPGQKLYLKTVDPESKADIVIDNNDPMNPFILNRGQA